ncbi:type VII secretion integral membrane protein EccD [Nonomuraea cavernae]|uniref:Type VII secretion integral membrane protein EccD n=1 Tax=Nonomuraea cavernae TaxID=2045107 RepID=A0A918DUI1_9ACTN|nr:type VII secretion integral membrane protein EccD [Nonomuraea cavernae]MCA2190069.1 type VII secretion integral membrane protein EccD [Nonomuraea cavernae]GGO82993.1 type VII secretion integral membrane protein EccD [Nonomuraea cavernae]
MRQLAQGHHGGPIPQGALPQVAAPLPPLCHVTIVAPRKRADLALPVDIPLPHVLPGLLRAMGEVGGESAAAPGWVLQRLGGPPFDIGKSLAALGVLDGEVLYLRPSELALPPALYDDVADLVATGVKERAGVWGDGHTRKMGLGAAMALLCAGPLALVLAGPPWTVAAIVSGALAVLLIVTGAVMSRAVGDSSSGVPAGYAALPYGFLAGLLAPTDAVNVLAPGAPSLLAALACTALVATFAGTLIADGVVGFLGAAIASVAGAAGTAVVMVFGLPAAGVAAVTVTILLALSQLIPTLAFRFARLPLPTMPTTAEELRNDNQLLDAPAIKERTVQARRYGTGMVVGISLVVIATHLLLVLDGHWMSLTMSVVLSLTVLLRARVFAGVGQRLWLLGSGVAGLAMLAISLSVGSGGVMAAVLVIGLLWAALISMGLGVWLPSGKPSPFWGRAGDIVDLMLIAALFPLALGVLEVYTWVRGLSG